MVTLPRRGFLFFAHRSRRLGLIAGDRLNNRAEDRRERREGAMDGLFLPLVQRHFEFSRLTPELRMQPMVGAHQPRFELKAYRDDELRR